MLPEIAQLGEDFAIPRFSRTLFVRLSILFQNSTKRLRASDETEGRWAVSMHGGEYEGWNRRIYLSLKGPCYPSKQFVLGITQSGKLFRGGSCVQLVFCMFFIWCKVEVRVRGDWGLMRGSGELPAIYTRSSPPTTPCIHSRCRTYISDTRLVLADAVSWASSRSPGTC